MATSPEKKHWWLTNRKIADKHVKAARTLVGTQSTTDISAALSKLEAALALFPRLEPALELKARCLIFLRRYREVAEMLKDYIPSYVKVEGAASSDESESFTSVGSSSSSTSSHRAKLLPGGGDVEKHDGGCSFGFFSVAELKRRLLAGLRRRGDAEGHWRYLVLGHACCHLGMMEDAMVLLQAGRRLAAAAFQRESTAWSDDTFTISATTAASAAVPPPPPTLPTSEFDSASNLLTHIKLLLRRRTAAFAALDAGLPNEAVRHFSKILDGHRGTPHAFAAGCLIGRASAYRAAGRITDAIADCNRALALDPASIPALRARADLLEAVRALNDCLRDLDHLKLLYDSILRDRKLPGPAWRPHRDVRYPDIPSHLRAVTQRIQEVRLAAGGNVDYYTLIGVRRGCSRSELERAHLVLTLRHKPEKAAAFIDRTEFADDLRDIDAVRDQARMPALILYRMLQKGYSSIMAVVMDEEAAERQRVKEARNVRAAAAVAANAVLKAATATASEKKKKKVDKSLEKLPAFQGVSCREIAAVGGLMSQVRFDRIPVKYEAVSC